MDDPFAVFASSPLPKAAKPTASAPVPAPAPIPEPEIDDEPLWINDDPEVDLAESARETAQGSHSWLSSFTTKEQPQPADADYQPEGDEIDLNLDAPGQHDIEFTPSRHAEALASETADEPFLDESELAFEAKFDDEALVSEEPTEALDLTPAETEQGPAFVHRDAPYAATPEIESIDLDAELPDLRSDELDQLESLEQNDAPEQRIALEPESFDLDIHEPETDSPETELLADEEDPLIEPETPPANDWDLLRPSRERHEPVFDDDNGLESESESSRAFAVEESQPEATDEHFAVADEPIEATESDVEESTSDETITEQPEAEIPTAETPPLPVEMVDFGETDENWVDPSSRVETVDIANPLPKNRPKAKQIADALRKPANSAPLSLDDSWTLEPMGHDSFDHALSQHQKHRFPWKAVLWTLAALLLGTVLAAQYLWSQRVEMRDDPTFGPLIESTCEFVGCELPPKRDINKIVIKQKSVIKERDDARKLKIDLLIVNQAGFDQPYPDLMLRFTNIEGKVVAEDQFAPNEYLREMPEEPMMPMDIPVHVSFIVRSPSDAVTGYEFRFLEPKPAK